MRKFILAIVLLFSLINSSSVLAQSDMEKAAILNALVDNDRFMKDQKIPSDPTSPFTPEQLHSFTGLNYFAVDEKWRIPARLQRDEEQIEEQLKMSDGTYIPVLRYGTVSFELQGKAYKLAVYRDQNFPELSDHPGCLFIPFTDLTSKIETYPGGRYLIIKIPRDGQKLQLDFNRAFNPFSAYNPKNISVFTPSQNQLTLSVNAGEQSFIDPAQVDELSMAKKAKLPILKP